MAKLTRPQLATAISSRFPDNTRGAITPAVMRLMLADIKDSYDIQNVLDPHDYGAYGDACGENDGVVSGASFDQFSSASWVFTAADVGKYLWFDTTDRTITAVANGVATFTPAHNTTANSLQWLAGHDDTTAIQAALDAARAMCGPNVAETAGSLDGMLLMGGVVQLRASHAYIISNSQTEYETNGKQSALIVYRRTSLIGAGPSYQSTQLCLRPNSYGHMISTPDPVGTTDAELSFTDFVTLGRFTLRGYSGWSANALDGIHWLVAFNGYDGVDPYNRIYDIYAYKCKRDGFFFKGRGELVTKDCWSIYSGQYGFHFDGQTDHKVINCNAGGNQKAGFKIRNAGPGHFMGCKSFYNGAGGTTSKGDSANWWVTADQMFNGQCFFTSCEAQESRGSSWLIESGMNIFQGCTANDPGRTAIAGGTLPSVVSGFHLSGHGCRNNLFTNCIVQPSVAIWGADNWGNAGDAVTIDGLDGNGAGPQANRGDIYTMVPGTTNQNGSIDTGIDYDAGKGALAGAGASNGKNTGLRVDGVACT